MLRAEQCSVKNSILRIGVCTNRTNWCMCQLYKLVYVPIMPIGVCTNWCMCQLVYVPIGVSCTNWFMCQLVYVPTGVSCTNGTQFSSAISSSLCCSTVETLIIMIIISDHRWQNSDHSFAPHALFHFCGQMMFKVFVVYFTLGGWSGEVRSGRFLDLKIYCNISTF